MSPANGGRSRSGSPPGGSTFTTSAPRSASSRPASAPRRSVKSTTRRCASGGGMRPGAYHAFRPAHSLRKCLRMRHGACAHGLPGAVLPSSRVAGDEVRRHLGLMAAATETFADLRLTARLRSATAIMLAIVPVFLALGGIVASIGSHVLGRYRQGLARRQAELAELSMRLMSLHEEERHRLSRDLHEDIGQSLAAVSAYLQAIEHDLPPALGELRARTADARRLASKTVAQLRQLAQLLRPSVLDDYR